MEPKTNGKVAKADGKVAKADVLTPVVMGEMFDMRKNLEGLEPRLPQIKILHGETQLYHYPDDTKIATFEAIILDFNRCNAYWKIPFSDSGGGTPPDCASLDAIELDPMSEEPQSTTGKCKDCPHNVFGSDTKKEDSKGKACKNMMRIHLLFENQMIPFRLTIPPTSLVAMDTYIPLVASKGLPYQLVRTVFSLKQDKNKKGIKFSKVELNMGAVITTIPEAQAIKKFHSEWQSLMRSQEIMPDEAE